MPVDVLVGLIRQIGKQGGQSKVLAMLADEAGFELVPKATAQSPGASVLDQLADLTARFTPVQVKIMQAEADGAGVDAREAAEILPVVKAFITEGVELEQILERKIAGKIIPIHGSAA